MRIIRYSILIISALISILGLLNLFGIFGKIIDLITSCCEGSEYVLKVIIFIVVIYYMICIIINERKNKKEFILGVNTKRYYKYFIKWYQKTGHISIFCGNLKWINNQKLMDILIQKSEKGQLSIYIETIDDNSQTLRAAGAETYIVKKNMKSFSFSIRNVDESESCIIRYNTEDDHTGKNIKITVHEIYKEPQKIILKALSNSIIDTEETNEEKNTNDIKMG